MKIDKKKTAMIAGAIVALLLLPWGCNTYYCWHYEKQAQPLINIVEQYKKTTGKLPRTSAEVGFNEGEFSAGPFYQYVDSTHYQVFYADEFNNFYIYDSSTGKWRSMTDTPMLVK